jgi:transposase InsO family protein
VKAGFITKKFKGGEIMLGVGIVGCGTIGSELAMTIEQIFRDKAHELLNGEVFTTLTEAKIIIEQWRREYNEVRPHSALGYRPPAPEAKLSLTLT